MRRSSIVLSACLVGGAFAAFVVPSLGATADGSDQPARVVTTAATAVGADATPTSIAAASTVAAAPADAAALVTSPASANAVAIRTTPPTPPATVPANTEGSASCPKTGRGAVIDRARQRGWLCTDGVADAKFPITTAVSQPNPGTYHVYAKDKVTTSTFGGHFSYLDNFVAFTRGVNTGARIAFHAVPRTSAGAPFQPYDTVGTPAWFGESSGCIRVLPAESQVIWDHLAIGDTVVVIS